MAMEEQLQYLKSAFNVRKEFENLTENLNKWLKGAELILEMPENGVDFQTVDFKHSELQVSLNLFLSIVL